MPRLFKTSIIALFAALAASGAHAQYAAFDLPRLAFPSDETINRPEMGAGSCQNRACSDGAR